MRYVTNLIYLGVSEHKVYSQLMGTTFLGKHMQPHFLWVRNVFGKLVPQFACEVGLFAYRCTVGFMIIATVDEVT